MKKLVKLCAKTNGDVIKMMFNQVGTMPKLYAKANILSGLKRKRR